MPDSELTPERVEGTVQDETWGDVPVTIRVFTEVEKKIKARRKQRMAEMEKHSRGDVADVSHHKEQSGANDEHRQESSLQSNTHQKHLQHAQ